MAGSPTASAELKVVRRATVRLVGYSAVDDAEVERFLAEHGVQWTTDTEVGGERLAEMAGRLCYMSFGKGRKTNQEYLGHILEVAHGSVLEHATWSFVISGVSRSFTHELVRHRAGFAYSQLSQRYVDESDAEYVVPDSIADDPDLHRIWTEAVAQAHDAYVKLVDGLAEKFADHPDRTMRRKMARQAARSVLPNATETKIFVTANARALRHFVELRGSPDADVEIRAVAVQMLQILRERAPNLFGDFSIAAAPDGTQVVTTPHRKV